MNEQLYRVAIVAETQDIPNIHLIIIYTNYYGGAGIGR